MGESVYKRVLQHQGMLRIVSHEALAALYPDVRRKNIRFVPEVLAEMAHRWWLYSAGNPGFIHDTCFQACFEDAGLFEASALRAWCQGQQAARDYCLPPTVRGTAVEPHLDLLLRSWEQAHGAVPFVRDSDDPDLLPAVALPFEISDSPLPGPPVAAITNRLGEPGNLDLAQALADACACATVEGRRPPANLRIIFNTLGGPCDKLLDGRSAGLPLLVALVLKAEGRHLPPLKAGFSGEISTLRVLDPVHAPWTTKDRLLTEMGVPQRVLPRVQEITQVADVLRLARESAVLLPACATEDTDREARAINQQMHFGQITAQEACARAQRLLAGPLASPGRRLKSARHHALLALASARCHLGEVAEARALCDQLALEMPGGGRDLIAQAKVRLAVVETDWARHASAIALCDEALAEAANVSNEEKRLDLQMRALGTKGQALLHQSLLPGFETARDEALRCLEENLALARELDHGHLVPGEQDTPRSAAGVFLWHAFHNPVHAGAAWHSALADAPQGSISRLFLQRHAHLARYRALLIHQVASPDWWPAEDIPIPVCPPELDWLAKTALKYRGTLHAHHGRWEEAMADFIEACKLCNAPSMLLKFLGGTCAIQAGRSLLLKDPPLAKAFLHQAAVIFEESRDLLAPPVSGACWLSWAASLNGDAASSPDPQCHFLY